MQKQYLWNLYVGLCECSRKLSGKLLLQRTKESRCAAFASLINVWHVNPVATLSVSDSKRRSGCTGSKKLSFRAGIKLVAGSTPQKHDRGISCNIVQSPNVEYH